MSHRGGFGLLKSVGGQEPRECMSALGLLPSLASAVLCSHLMGTVSSICVLEAMSNE